MLTLFEIGSGVLDKKIFFNFINVFKIFSYYLPLEMGGVLHSNKAESPSPKDALCQVWLNRPRGFGIFFFKFRPCIFVIRNYLPLEKGGGPSFD